MPTLILSSSSVPGAATWSPTTVPDSLSVLTYTKSADETRTNSAALTADSQLTTGLTTLTPGYYWVSLNLFVTRTDALNNISLTAAMLASTGQGYFASNQASAVARMDGNQTLTPAVLVDPGYPRPIVFTGSLHAIQATTLSLLWGQSAPSPTGITVMKGSQMIITKTA